MAARKYSERLGVIDDRQFEAALARMGLGDFVRAEPISGGLFGQNVFVTSTMGDWVLRGVPHYDWQLPAEQFFCELLHTRTRTPAPWPYLLDPSDDIFGWSYAIMPRMPGFQPSEPMMADDLTHMDRIGIAHALAENLVLMQELTWPVCGGFDLASGTIAPWPVGWAEWVVADVRRWIDMARNHSDRTPDADVRWVEELLQSAHHALAEPFSHASLCMTTRSRMRPSNVMARPGE